MDLRKIADSAPNVRRYRPIASHYHKDLKPHSLDLLPKLRERVNENTGIVTIGERKARVKNQTTPLKSGLSICAFCICQAGIHQRYVFGTLIRIETGTVRVRSHGGCL